jgi:hypothetical protein
VEGDGRVLLGNEVEDRHIEALMAGDAAPRELSLRASSGSYWMSPDGSVITIADQGVPGYEAYLFRADSAAPVRVGHGQAYGISSDGKWLAAMPIDTGQILIHPTGAGESRQLPNPDKLLIDSLAWLPDASGIVLFGQPAGHRSRGYVQKIAGGPPRPFTPEGVGLINWWSMPVSPDGTRVVARNADGQMMMYGLDGGTPQAVPGLQLTDIPAEWSADGRALLVAHGDGRPWIVDRLNVATGTREKAFEVRPAEIAGLRLTYLALARDGRHYVHSFSRLLSTLYIVEGLH